MTAFNSISAVAVQLSLKKLDPVYAAMPKSLPSAVTSLAASTEMPVVSAEPMPRKMTASQQSQMLMNGPTQPKRKAEMEERMRERPVKPTPR